MSSLAEYFLPAGIETELSASEMMSRGQEQNRIAIHPSPQNDFLEQKQYVQANMMVEKAPVSPFVVALAEAGEGRLLSAEHVSPCEDQSPFPPL